MHFVVLTIYAVFIAFVSVRPMSSASIEPWDKLFHLILYGVFAVLAYPVFKENRKYLYLCAGIVLYGGLMEFAQSYMPGRVMSVYDLMANTVGVVLGAVIAKKLLGDKGAI